MRTIRQSVTFPRAQASALYDAYLHPKKHEALTGGGKASISPKEGAPFSAWDGYIEGRNLALVPKRLIVQAWRTTEFGAKDPDSLLVLAFRDEARGARLDMVHANLPDDQADSYAEGWTESYWKPWKAFIRESASRTR